MDVREGEIKVYYKHNNGVFPEVDDAIRDTLAKFGFKMWASGCNLVNGVRDLAFKKEPNLPDDEG